MEGENSLCVERPRLLKYFVLLINYFNLKLIKCISYYVCVLDHNAFLSQELYNFTFDFISDIFRSN